MSNEPDSPISEGNPVKEETEKQEGKKGEVKEEEQWRRISWPHLQWRRKKKSHIEEEDEGLLVCKWWDACQTGRQGCDRWCIAPSRRKEDLTEAVHHYCVSTKNKKSVFLCSKKDEAMTCLKGRRDTPTLLSFAPWLHMMLPLLAPTILQPLPNLCCVHVQNLYPFPSAKY